MEWARVLGAAATRRQGLRTLGFLCSWELLAWVVERLAPAALKADREERARFAERVTSLAHALVTIGLCSWILWVDPDEETQRASMERDHMYGHSDGAMVLFASSCGYFAWDLYATLSKSTVEWGFVVHAVACFLCYLFGQFPYLHYYGVRFLLFELSTPFLNVMLLLRQVGSKGALHSAVQSLFGYSFLACRILYGFPLSYFFWQESLELLRSGKQHSAFVVVYYLVANLALNGLNAFWLVGMLTKRRKAN